MKKEIVVFIIITIIIIIFTLLITALTYQNTLTDTYNNWNCLNKCFKIYNLSPQLHSSYADCSDLCAAGKINDQECYIHGNKIDCNNLTEEEIAERWLE